MEALLTTSTSAVPAPAPAPAPREASAPGRVRWATYIAFALIATLCAGQSWLTHERERVRLDDAEILAQAGLQRSYVQAVGRQAALATSRARVEGDPAAALHFLLERSKAVALHAENLLVRHGAPPESLAAWQTARELLWYRGEVLLRQLDAGAETAAQATALVVQRDTGLADGAAQALVDELQAAARQRSDLARHQLANSTTALLALLLTLALLVAEPTARAVRRQVDRLAAQAADLERLALVAERTHSLVFVTDVSRRIQWVNDAFTQLTGYSLQEALGQDPATVLHGGHADERKLALMNAAFERGEGLRIELHGRSKSGRDYWLDADLQPLRDADGRLTGYVAVETDITEQVTQRLRNAALLAALPTGVVVQSVDGTTIDGNRAAELMLGQSREQLLGGDPLDPSWQALREDGSELPVAEHPAMRTLRSGCGLRGESMGVRGADGSERWLLVNTEPLHDALGRLDGVVSCFADITDSRRLQDQLSAGARTDALTELPNRTVVHERVQRAIEHARRHPGYGFAVLFMDFDRFKQVNDTLGHGVGDELLRQIAGRLLVTLRPGDTIGRADVQRPTAARIGGDEFVVVLEGVRGANEAHVVAQRLLEVLTQPYTIGPHHVQSSVSIGVVLSAQAGDSADAVLRDADTAMYEAKRAGRGRYVMFDASMHERVVRALGVENDLRRALRDQELFVVYQPVIDLETGVVCGVEALARWRHPQRGLVPPVEFIPVAEECGLIGPLGDYVLDAACRQFAAWDHTLGATTPAQLAVNVSRAQLMTPGLVASVRKVLADTGLDASRLQLEVTESLAAQDQTVQNTLNELKALGVRLALDDFGTGYSSLACLHQMPVDTVKIDRSFLNQVESSGYHRVVIEATIRVAQTLGMICVAEGVETLAQAALMRSLHCQRGQGYLYSPPLPAPDLERWITARATAAPKQLAAAAA